MDLALLHIPMGETVACSEFEAFREGGHVWELSPLSDAASGDITIDERLASCIPP